MKQIIGAYRYFYNQGVSYLSSLERGFFIPDKNSKKKAEYIKYENDFLKVETGGECMHMVLYLSMIIKELKYHLRAFKQ
jgi:hypothetical protein